VLVSVVIVNYNYGRFLGAAVASALAQAHSDVEVVVVDDGSTDESRDVLGSYAGRVRTVLKENGGMASAQNAGFALSRGDLVIFLDSDDVLEPDAAQRAAAAADPGVAQVRWPMREIDVDGRDVGRISPEERLEEGDLLELVAATGPHAYRTVVMSANAWSRRFLGAVLPIPEREFRLHSDSYLAALAPVYGRIVAIPEPLTRYRIHGANDWACDTVVEKAGRILENYELLARLLADRLRERGIEADTAKWRRRNQYYGWLVDTRRAVAELETLVSEGDTVILVDEEDWGGSSDGVLPGRRVLPFLERDGEYWGSPADDETAIRELERLRADGARFLVFPWFSFWWLDCYPRFRDHLERRFRRCAVTPRLVAYALDER